MMSVAKYFAPQTLLFHQVLNTFLLLYLVSCAKDVYGLLWEINHNYCVKERGYCNVRYKGLSSPYRSPPSN